MRQEKNGIDTRLLASQTVEKGRGIVERGGDIAFLSDSVINVLS